MALDVHSDVRLFESLTDLQQQVLFQILTGFPFQALFAKGSPHESAKLVDEKLLAKFFHENKRFQHMKKQSALGRLVRLLPWSYI